MKNHDLLLSHSSSFEGPTTFFARTGKPANVQIVGPFLTQPHVALNVGFGSRFGARIKLNRWAALDDELCASLNGD